MWMFNLCRFKLLQLPPPLCRHLFTAYLPRTDQWDLYLCQYYMGHPRTWWCCWTFELWTHRVPHLQLFTGASVWDGCRRCHKLWCLWTSSEWILHCDHFLHKRRWPKHHRCVWVAHRGDRAPPTSGRCRGEHLREPTAVLQRTCSGYMEGMTSPLIMSLKLFPLWQDNFLLAMLKTFWERLPCDNIVWNLKFFEKVHI